MTYPAASESSYEHGVPVTSIPGPTWVTRTRLDVSLRTATKVLIRTTLERAFDHTDSAAAFKYAFVTQLPPPHRTNRKGSRGAVTPCDSRSRTNGLFFEETGLGNTLINV